MTKRGLVIKMAKGFLLVLSGPSGSGKGTVSKALLEKRDDIVYSVSATTRKPRDGEINGENYYFMTEEEFNNKVEAGGFLEHAFVHANYYGTPKDFVFKQIEKGEIVFLEIDVQGALQIKKNYKEAVFIFLLPPTMDELKSRIIKRGTETEEDINRRFSNAFKELDFVGEYDFFVVNDKVENAVADIEAIIHSEKLRVKRHNNIKKQVMMQGGSYDGK
jgi:guanylate kinase